MISSITSLIIRRNKLKTITHITPNMSRENNENQDIFFRKKYCFLIQHGLESKVFDWLQEKFEVETVNTKKGKLVILEGKVEEE